MSHLFKTFEEKDPVEVLDYLFDWAGNSNNNGLTDWLEPGETITDHEVTVGTGLVLVNSTVVNSNSAVLVWLSGGAANNDYEVRCQITTSSNRIAIRTAILPVRQR